MTDDPFDRLWDAMPKIAEAVNVFASPDVGRRAFATWQSRPSAPRWDDTGTKRCGTAASARDSTEHGLGRIMRRWLPRSTSSRVTAEDAAPNQRHTVACIRVVRGAPQQNREGSVTNSGR